MKIAAAYMVYSGFEFLKPALLNMRPLVDYQAVVYSTQSSNGIPASSVLLPLLQQLKRDGLIDDLVEFTIVKSKDPLALQNIERQKRELLRQRCLNAGCTHISMHDCDEFYNQSQFQNILADMKQHDMSLAPIYDYLGSPRIRSRGVSELYVPVLQKAYIPFVYHNPPVLVDRGRVIPTDDFYILKEPQLVMHHMTGVRFNETELRRKFVGHPHWLRLGEQEAEGAFQSYLHPDMKVYAEVPDQFGILEYWTKEFADFYRSHQT